jgi:2-polyprenyl-3-methyl-5-hydroxy-6-metoxy-1,4-benzoquinol methylase
MPGYDVQSLKGDAMHRERPFVSTIKFTGEFMVPGQSGDRLEADHWARYRFAGPFARGMRALDIACGYGYGSDHLLKSGASRVVGVDMSAALVENARKVYTSPGLSFHQGDIRVFREGTPFDLITCFETIEHVPDYPAALHNLFSLLAPGGTLLISSPNRPITSPRAPSLSDSPSNPHHVQEFTITELQGALKEAGFEVDASVVFGQRQRRVFSNRLVNKMYLKICKPDSRFSAEVLPVDGRVPRYFIVRARKTS